jgi:hypothetical protein
MVNHGDLKKYHDFPIQYYPVLKQVRGFNPIGMLEFWNIGKME